MSERRYDPELLEAISLLPTVVDFSDLEKVKLARELSAATYISTDNPAVAKDDRTVPGPEGAPDVPVRIYRPAEVAEGRLPAVLEIHGGGFILGSLAMMEDWCQAVALMLPAVVVSVDYRLAPEHPFPAGLEDCYAALCWLAAEADALGVDPARIAVAGQSAGGNLAAATCLLQRDRSGPAICFQLLEIPELDDRLETPSMREFVDTPVWNRPNAIWSWRHYLGPNHQGDVPPYAAPARATDLSGLPPTCITVAEFDPLRDEGILYAHALMQAGVPTELYAQPGTFHGSIRVREASVTHRYLRVTFEALANGVAAKP